MYQNLFNEIRDYWRYSFPCWKASRRNRQKWLRGFSRLNATIRSVSVKLNGKDDRVGNVEQKIALPVAFPKDGAQGKSFAPSTEPVSTSASESFYSIDSIYAHISSNRDESHQCRLSQQGEREFDKDEEEEENLIRRCLSQIWFELSSGWCTVI